MLSLLHPCCVLFGLCLFSGPLWALPLLLDPRSSLSRHGLLGLGIERWTSPASLCWTAFLHCRSLQYLCGGWKVRRLRGVSVARGRPPCRPTTPRPVGHCLSSPFCWLVDGLAWLFWGCLCLSVDVRTALSLLSSTLLHCLRALHESLDGLLGSEACCAGRLGGVLAFGFLLVCNIGMLIVPGVSEGWDVMSLLALDLWGMPESVGACSRSVALGVLLALLCALRCHRSGGSNRHVKGRLWTCLVAPLACCSPSQPVLVWRRPPVPRCHRRTGCGNLQRWLIRLIGFSCLPQRVFAVPGDLLVELQGLDLGRSPHVATILVAMACCLRPWRIHFSSNAGLYRFGW